MVKNFGPIFDSKGVQLGLEHHYHCFKRSYRIFENKINPDKGTYYLGDGSWGVNPTSNIEKSEFLEKVGQKNVVNAIIASKDGMIVTAFDENGVVLDNLIIKS